MLPALSIAAPPWQAPIGWPPGVFSKKFGTMLYFSSAARAGAMLEARAKSPRREEARCFMRGRRGCVWTFSTTRSRLAIKESIGIGKSAAKSLIFNVPAPIARGGDAPNEPLHAIDERPQGAAVSNRRPSKAATG